MGVIHLKTAIPGPRSQALMKRRNDAVPRGVFHSTPVFAARAEGAVVEDVDGNRFIDFAGGIGCTNVGHRAAPVLAAIREQLERFLHTCFSVSPYESYVALAERLNKLVPGEFAKKTLLVNSGAEAVENAIKIARAHTKRPAVICFEHAFHGRTLLALSLTSKTHPYKAGFSPFVNDVYRVPYPFCYECGDRLRHAFCPATIEVLHHAFKHTVAAESVAAIIIEPVLGEGGFMAPPAQYLRDLAQLCRENGILLIADEVQTGIARTGMLFACEHFRIAPDILVSAKSLGGGMPIAAVTGRAEIMDVPGPGGLGGTFVGNPVACQAALAVLETVEREKLCARARELGAIFLRRAEAWQRLWPQIRCVHGVGAMRSVELWHPERREPAVEETRAIVKYCYEHGLLTISAGTYSNTLRLLVPLTIPFEQYEEGLAVMESALHQVFTPAATARGARRAHG